MTNEGDADMQISHVEFNSHKGKGQIVCRLYNYVQFMLFSMSDVSA